MLQLREAMDWPKSIQLGGRPEPGGTLAWMRAEQTPGSESLEVAVSRLEAGELQPQQKDWWQSRALDTWVSGRLPPTCSMPLNMSFALPRL